MSEEGENVKGEDVVKESVSDDKGLNEPAEPTKASMTDGLEDKKKEEYSSVPEGIDKELFDEESRTLKVDAVREALKKKDADIENYKKQATDMRRKLSKGVDIPKDIKDYAEKYVPDDRYINFVEDKESEVGKHISDVMGALDNFAFNHGLSIETTKDFKDLVLSYMEDVKILDTRSDEEKAADDAKFLKEQKEILGDNADQIIKDNLNFFKNYGIFNDDEKKLLMSSMGKNAAWNTIGFKIRKLFGQNTTADIPNGGVAIGGLPDDVTLAKEYNAATTSPQRRMQILQQRIDSGRTGKLPTVF